MSAWSFSKHIRKAGKLDQLKKKQDLRPVIIDGGVIARTWWGKAWNRNLESYAEYASRIGRGRSSVGSGAILDLQVSAGEITALVQGSRAKPYQVLIRIQKLNKNTWNLVASACRGKLASARRTAGRKIPQGSRRSVHAAKDRLVPVTQGDRIRVLLSGLGEHVQAHCSDALWHRRQARRRPDALFYASRCCHVRPDQRSRIEQEVGASPKDFAKEFPDD